ncbi:MAG: Asp23/Gls24 family envelope stress response protein [Clostridia bacterium]|nr:Asp23/Gls24 family envelope stress response protein [Clostridia bacterium]
MNKNEGKGNVYYSRSILNNIILLAVEEVEGVAFKQKGQGGKRSVSSRPEVKIDFCKEGVFVDVSVVVKNDCSVPDLSFRIQENVKRAVESMTEFKVVEVNIAVLDVVFEEDEGKE